MSQGRNLQMLQVAVIALLAAAGYIYLHIRAGYSFPVPWPDESAYLWSAIGLARSGNLLATEMNPYLHAMLIPPGYFVVTAPVFAIFGFSLDLARACSAAEILIFFGLLLAITTRMRTPLASALVCAVFALSAEFILAGNIARMEALVLLLVGLGMWTLARGQLVAGVAVVALASLVHPNGAYFGVAAVVFVLLQPDWFGRVRRTRRTELVVLAISVSLWLAYGAYVAAHLPEFELQMRSQFQRKLGRGGVTSSIFGAHLKFIAPIALAAAWSFRRNARAFLFCCFALAGWAAPIFGNELWYGVFQKLALLLGTLALLELVQSLLASRIEGLALRTLAAFAVALLLLSAHWYRGSLPFPPAAPHAIQALQMGFDAWEPIPKPGELDQVMQRLQPWTQCGRRVVVRVHPQTDALFLYEQLGETSVLLSAPARIMVRLHKQNPLYMPPPWDAYLIHTTPNPIAHLAPPLRKAFNESRIDRDSETHLIAGEGTASRWYLRVRDANIRRKCSVEGGIAASSTTAGEATCWPPGRVGAERQREHEAGAERGAGLPVVLPLGDSITEGAGDVPPLFGYRDHLQRLLGPETLQMIGTTTHGAPADSPYDTHHAGYGGATSGHVLLAMPAVIPLVPSDAAPGSSALIHIGNNDMGQNVGGSTAKSAALAVRNIETILAQLRERAPALQLHVALVIPSYLKNKNPGIDHFNELLRARMETLRATRPEYHSRLHIVDVNGAFRAYPRWRQRLFSIDRVHPNDRGHRVIAHAFYESMLSACRPGSKDNP